MNKVIRRSLQGAAIAGGIVIAGAGAAQASDSLVGDLKDINVSSVDETLNNNKVNVDVPVNTAVTVVGDATAIQGGHGVSKKAAPLTGDIVDVNVLSVDETLNNNKIDVDVPVNTAATVVGDATAIQGGHGKGVHKKAAPLTGDLKDINVLAIDETLNNNKINVDVPVNTALTVVGDALAVQK